MITYQLITISTTKGRQLHIHLDERASDLYKCLISEIRLGPTPSGAAEFGPFSEGKNAEQAFESMIEGIQKSLSNLDPDDTISEVDSDGDYLIRKGDQSKYLPPEVSIKVYGE